MEFNKLEIGEYYYISLFGGAEVECVYIDKEEKEATFIGNIYAGKSENRITLNKYEIRLHIH